MPEFFDIILASMSSLLFSSPAFVKLALSGARQVQDSSSPVTGGSSFREVPVFDKANERAAYHDAERPSLGRRPTFNELSGDTLSSKSATGGVITGNSPIIFSKPYYPPSDSDDDMTLAQNSFSLVSDNSVEDEFIDSRTLDTLLSSTSCSTVTGTLPSSKGLGISGLTRKDGSGSFDGLGIVSIKSSAWRHDDLPQSEILQFGDGIDQSIQEFDRSSSTYDGSLDSEDFATGDAGISDMFLQQTLQTFTQDPFHHFCHSIPDCDNNNSWSELGLGLGDESASTTSMSELSAKNDSRPSMMMMNYRHRPKLNTNFSSATISSELKRSSMPKNNWRPRSSSWPSSTMDGTVSSTPRKRCKWKL